MTRTILFRDPAGKIGPCPDGLECMHPWHGRVTPIRIQRKRTAGWRMPEGAVYVGRLGNGLAGWGNPFIVSEHQTAEQAVENFRRALLEGRLQHSVAKVQRELRGRDLACWCPISAPCHADVLLEVANR